MKNLLFVFALVFCTVSSAVAQVLPYNISVAAEATIQEQPPRITLTWLADDSATSYSISRYDADNGLWKFQTSLSKTALTWADTNVIAWTSYEYHIKKNDLLYDGINQGFGY